MTSGMYSSRRGWIRSCEICGSKNLTTDIVTGELHCVECGYVITVEQIPGIEKDSEGNMLARTADKKLGSLVDWRSTPQQRRWQKFDGLENYSGFEREMMSLIKKIFPEESRKDKLTDLETILKVKRDFTTSYRKQTQDTKIPFFPTGGRSTGNYMPCLALVQHWPKIVKTPSSSIMDSINELEGILSDVEELPPQLKPVFDKKTVKFVMRDLNGLKSSWKFLLKNRHTGVPSYPDGLTQSDTRESIIKARELLFKQKDPEFIRRIYSVETSIFNAIHIHPAKQSLRNLVFELERLSRGCTKRELNDALSTRIKPSPQISEKAEQIFSIIAKQEMDI